jgi:hypothetical protein
LAYEEEKVFFIYSEELEEAVSFMRKNKVEPTNIESF